MKEKILAKIYETCPELKALEFGCRILTEKDRIVKLIGKGTNGEHTWYTWIGDDTLISGEEFDGAIKQILGKEPHLEHLLRTIDNNQFYIDSVGDVMYESRYIMSYDLTKTVEQNLENEELANFIGEILFD